MNVRVKLRSDDPNSPIHNIRLSRRGSISSVEHTRSAIEAMRTLETMGNTTALCPCVNALDRIISNYGTSKTIRPQTEPSEVNHGRDYSELVGKNPFVCDRSFRCREDTEIYRLVKVWRHLVAVKRLRNEVSVSIKPGDDVLDSVPLLTRTADKLRSRGIACEWFVPSTLVLAWRCGQVEFIHELRYGASVRADASRVKLLDPSTGSPTSVAEVMVFDRIQDVDRNTHLMASVCQEMFLRGILAKAGAVPGRVPHKHALQTSVVTWDSDVVGRKQFLLALLGG